MGIGFDSGTHLSLLFGAFFVTGMGFFEGFYRGGDLVGVVKEVWFEKEISYSYMTCFWKINEQLICYLGIVKGELKMVHSETVVYIKYTVVHFILPFKNSFSVESI